MTTAATAQDAGQARWTFRLRVSSTALAALLGEWDRCRWIWNECCAKSKQTHLWNKTRPRGTDKRTCGPAQLDKMLTEARTKMPWLGEGSSVPQQQLIRDFGKSRAKAQKDIKERLPARRRAGMPKYKKKREALASLN
ncbi:MAG TPA: transposase, partial [Actinoallomurus sp.]|nr:transposase [Actinoallomurus sp.]